MGRTNPINIDISKDYDVYTSEKTAAKQFEEMITDKTQLMIKLCARLFGTPVKETVYKFLQLKNEDVYDLDVKKVKKTSIHDQFKIIFGDLVEHAFECTTIYNDRDVERIKDFVSNNAEPDMIKAFERILLLLVNNGTITKKETVHTKQGLELLKRLETFCVPVKKTNFFDTMCRMGTFTQDKNSSTSSSTCYVLENEVVTNFSKKMNPQHKPKQLDTINEDDRERSYHEASQTKGTIKIDRLQKGLKDRRYLSSDFTKTNFLYYRRDDILCRHDSNIVKREKRNLIPCMVVGMYNYEIIGGQIKTTSLSHYEVVDLTNYKNFNSKNFIPMDMEKNAINLLTKLKEDEQNTLNEVIDDVFEIEID